MVQHPYVLIRVVLFKRAFIPLLKWRVGLVLCCCFSQDVFFVWKTRNAFESDLECGIIATISEQCKQLSTLFS